MTLRYKKTIADNLVEQTLIHIDLLKRVSRFNEASVLIKELNKNTHMSENQAAKLALEKTLILKEDIQTHHLHNHVSKHEVTYRGAMQFITQVPFLTQRIEAII